MSKTKFCICQCFFTKNLFVKQYKLHVTYLNRGQFLQEYSETLHSQGCSDPEAVISELESEVTRRKNFHKDSWSRQVQIAKEYEPLHPHLYRLQRSFLDPKFISLVDLAKTPGTTVEELSKVMKQHQQRMYSFPVFTSEFCQTFLSELKNFEESRLPKGRPNTMNRYGINLGELGFDNFVTSLRNDFITPLTRILYPDWGGDCLDSHKAFIVKYEVGKDVDLNYHFDNAEVTLNVALNDDYYDGEIYFGPMRTEESSKVTGIAHQIGVGLLHRAQQMHGALPISEGIRYNLILWMRSSAIRNELCPMCNEKPTLIPVENGFGDGFTVNEVDICCAS